ncbi:N-formylglutamate amidohydrolase [Sphingomonas tabacisoli]|uniref:N-formylglutamate amidohydrolase n=1 Tax=Sphingomonas tabacisoli TaxID=2249466 RepID=A0ABW4I0C5_9SPHN
MALPNPAFELTGADLGGPVILSVPHAGRLYTPEHRAKLRPPAERLIALEDRFVDAVAADAGAPTVIALAPRAWIDLNRHEAEIDPGLVEGAVASRLMMTPKVRSGLGLIPRRLTGVGEIWRGRLSLREVEQRISEHHRPYHAMLAAQLNDVARNYGVAILVDLHSMPPLGRTGEADSPQVVIGNRFGHSAAPWITARIGATCARFGLSWRENSPYAGGHVVERHGAPAKGVHAVQVELDRALYLNASLDQCDPEKLAFSQGFVRELIADLGAAALDSGLPLAAE